MKYLFILLFTLCGWAQEINDRIVFLDSLEQLANDEQYDFIRVFKNYYSKQPSCEVYDYYKSGKRKMVGKLIDKYNRIKDGTFVYYYENGNRKSIMNYVLDAPQGMFYTWYEKGMKETVGEFLKVKSNSKKPYLKIHQHWSRIGIQRVVDGNGKFFDEDLTSSSEGELKNGFKEGEWYGTDYLNRATFTEKYKAGILISGISIDSTQTSYDYTEIETKATPKKGEGHFKRYLEVQIQKKFEADKSKPRGRIILEFVVGKNGFIKNVEVLQKIGFGLDEEAVRILKNYDPWIPAKNRGMNVACSYTIPINIWSE